jgi:hypothetical protein
LACEGAITMTPEGNVNGVILRNVYGVYVGSKVAELPYVVMFHKKQLCGHFYRFFLTFYNLIEQSSST